MHSKKEDAAKSAKSAGRPPVPVSHVAAGGGTAYNPPTVNAKPAPHELNPSDKTAVKKAPANAEAGGEREFKILAAQSQILRASHGGLNQISQSSTPISSTPRPLTAATPRPHSEFGTWTTLGDRPSSERPREADRPRKVEDEREKLHRLCQLVTFARSACGFCVLLNASR